MSVLVLIPITLAANGAFGRGEIPMVAQNGCNIGLDSWYVFFSALACTKLLIEIFRYFVIKVKYHESVVLHIGGNFLLMPLAFAAFFIHTQSMWEHSVPDPDHVMGFREAKQATLAENICVNSDMLSQSLYSTFQIVSMLSYLVTIYYLVAFVVIVQSACLIRAIVQRRVNQMRRRDLEEAGTNGEGGSLEQF